MNNLNLPTTDNFLKIVTNNTPLIDVRAPIEFEKGAFLNSTNIPILTNEERHLVGICYKEKGNSEATKLGHSIVSGKTKEERIDSWLNAINDNPNTMIYCFRGGSRSRIAQQWITSALGRDILRLEGGYKAFRNYLINALTPEFQSANPVVLAGYTGSRKTVILNELENAVDLEGLANHRGSSFGAYITPQPSQINFENNLAYRLINLKDKEYKNIILEDEGRNVGKNFIPRNLAMHFKNSDLVIVEVSLEERIQNTLEEYVIFSQRDYIQVYGEENGIKEWFKYIESSMLRVKNKFGFDRLKIVLEELNRAYEMQLATGSYEPHRLWIELFLKTYYDPLYEASTKKDTRKLIFSGNTEEVKDFLKSLK